MNPQEDKPVYDTIDIALIYANCQTVLEVVKATDIFNQVYQDTFDLNIAFCRQISNRRVRQLVFEENE